MNKRLLLILAAGLFVFSSCEKNKDHINGKLVYQGCAAMVVQITDPEFYSLAQNEWTSIGGETFEHVFTVNNFCDFTATLQKGDNFTFRIVSKEVNCNLLYCFVYENPPTKNYTIELDKSAK